MNKSTGILLSISSLLLGVIIGFLIAPIKGGIGNNSGNNCGNHYYGNDEEESN
ncbi:MAG: hypothetical protein K0S61_1277 [Anaerocolumna sp.]|jgi:hypothetical protein|nr:hypothetical protein [Anaerocolumna sp.]